MSRSLPDNIYWLIYQPRGAGRMLFHLVIIYQMQVWYSILAYRLK